MALDVAYSDVGEVIGKLEALGDFVFCPTLAGQSFDDLPIAEAPIAGTGDVVYNGLLVDV